MLRLSILGFVLLVGLSPGAAKAEPVRWARNGHLYEAILVPTGITWLEANARARRRGCGWHLVTLTSAAEDRFVFGLISGRPEFFRFGFAPWIGGFQPAGSVEPAQGWRWVTNERFAYRDWNAGEPNNQGSENRLQYWPNGAWNDEDDALRTPGFIVEFSPRLPCRTR